MARHIATADGPVVGGRLSPARVGVVVCSQRTPRVGPQIGAFVLGLLRMYQAQHANSTQPVPISTVDLSLIDLAEQALPLYNEPGIPYFHTSASDYTYERTRNWSRLISSYNAFVFVTPEYNRGYPASVKNAIDYLFHEWRGKPAMLVGYGIDGGRHATRQLKEVLSGIGMRLAAQTVNLKFPTETVGSKAMKGEDLRDELAVDETGRRVRDGETKQGPIWLEERKTIWDAFQETLTLLKVEE